MLGSEAQSALLGIAGVDGIVDRARGGQLGLARNIAVLVNAPATSPHKSIRLPTSAPMKKC